MKVLGKCPVPECSVLLTEDRPICPVHEKGVERPVAGGGGTQPSVHRAGGWGRYRWFVVGGGAVAIVLVGMLVLRAVRTGGTGSGEGAQGGGTPEQKGTGPTPTGAASEIVGYEGRVAGEGKTRSRWGEIRGVRADGTTVDYNTLPQEMRDEAERLLQPHFGGVGMSQEGVVRVARPGHGGLPEGGPGEMGEQFPGVEGEWEAGKELTPAEEERAKAATSRKERLSEEEMRFPSFDVPGPPPIPIPGLKAEPPGATADTESAKEEAPGVGTPEVSGGASGGEGRVTGESSGP